MKQSRRIGAFLVASAAAVSMATVGLASPASAADSGPRPVSNWLRAVQADTDTWVNIGWRTNRRICDVEVRVDGGRRVEVDYPGWRDYTSFRRDDSLRPGRTDYTAILVNPDYLRAGIARLRATIEYDNCGRHARTQHRSTWLNLPVRDDDNGHGHGWPGDDGPGNGGPGHGWPGSGGPGNGGPGHDWPGDDGPGNGGPGHGWPGNGGPGNGGPGHDWPGNGGPGDGGPGHDWPGNGGPGNGGPGNGGPGNGGPGNGGPGNGGPGNGGPGTGVPGTGGPGSAVPGTGGPR